MGNKKINYKIIIFITLFFSSIFQLFSAETIHIGIYNNPPHLIRENDNFSGFTYDILNYIAKEKNLEIIYHYNTYKTNLDLLAIGLIDILPVNDNHSSYYPENPNFIHLKDESINNFPEKANGYNIIPCILVKKPSIASIFTENNLYSKMVPLINSNNQNTDFYNTVITKYNSENIPLINNKKGLVILTFLIVLSLSAIIISQYFKLIKSISRTGREIISEVESPDLYNFIYTKLLKLIKSDYFCIGSYNNSSLDLNIFTENKSQKISVLNEKIDNNESCFIYSVKNKKNIYIKNSDSDILKYVKDNKSLKKINNNISSAYIMPLIFNNEILGTAAVLDTRKISMLRRYLFTSISKYITISLKNRKLIDKNRELLDCIESDKNQILKAKQEVEYIAQHDPLTNLPNRLYLNEFLNQSIKKSNRTGKKLAVIFIDMDNFKEANDTYGHQVGDKVLIAAANRFKNLLRESDIVIRFGGDEFIIILEDVNSYEDVKQVTNKIIKTCTAPVLTETADLSLSFSIGISMYPDNGSSAEELIRKADIALYDVKNNIKGTWKFYS